MTGEKVMPLPAEPEAIGCGFISLTYPNVCATDSADSLLISPIDFPILNVIQAYHIQTEDERIVL